MVDNNLTDEQIEAAKATARYSTSHVLHQHNDCIRIAYEWLDAQRIISGAQTRSYPIKHLIERWGGRYVSQSDVEVAAHMHPHIKGKYPYFNISNRLTLPDERRLDGIGEANAHDNYREHIELRDYRFKE